MSPCKDSVHLALGKTKDNRCKECRRLSKLKYNKSNASKVYEIKKRWRQSNPEKTRTYGARWRANNPEKIRNKQLRRYKLTIEQWDIILTDQGDVCKLCKLPFGTEQALIPVVDHNHSCCNGRRSCGKCVRGIIHYKCNLLISFANDNPILLQLGIEYLTYDHTKRNTQKG